MEQQPDTNQPNRLMQKPTLYVMDKWSPEAMVHARELFHTIQPGDKGHDEWHEAQYLLIRGHRITSEVLDKCPNLLAIGKNGVGLDTIDTKACEERGVAIFNTPGVNARAVAELAVALAASVVREIGPIVQRQAGGEVVLNRTCSGLILHRKTVGILGMGNIGRTVARMFVGAYETPIIAYDPFLPQDAWADVPHRRAETIREVLEVADVLSIHIPLTTETRNSMSLPQFRLMKRSAILVNTARGGIVNEADLAIALGEGLIWGAGLDCHVQEPPSKEHYGDLWRYRVISTPHIGAATDETQMATQLTAINRLYAFVETSLS